MNKFLSILFKRPAILLLIATSTIVTPAAFAATQTVTLSVPGMTCAVCPITVREALKEVSGVIKITPSLEKKVVAVTYDDEKTSVTQLEKATRNVGYPSTVQPGKTK